MPGYLPPDLIAIVVSYLTLPLSYDPHIFQPLERVGQYACINRKWQMAIERHTFSTPDLTILERLAQFEQIVAKNPQHRAYVHRINLVVQLEAYDLIAHARFETTDERRRNNEIFTSTIHSLGFFRHGLRIILQGESTCLSRRSPLVMWWTGSGRERPVGTQKRTSAAAGMRKATCSLLKKVWMGLQL